MNKKFLKEIEKYKKKRNMDLIQESNWIYKFLLLLDFKKEFGHTNVPAKYKNNKPLGYWVRRQRLVFHQDKLDPMREDLLKLAGFHFRLLKFHNWNEMFRKVAAFKKQFGHVRITEGQADMQLYNWLVYQRKLYWKGKLEISKLDKLKDLGVGMKNRTVNRWNEKYRRLLQFKQEHGHLYVCKYFFADDQLINFVKVIRRNKDRISDERRVMLDKIGFIWEPGRQLTILINKERALKQRRIKSFSNTKKRELPLSK